MVVSNLTVINPSEPESTTLLMFISVLDPEQQQNSGCWLLKPTQLTACPPQSAHFAARALPHNDE